MPRLVFLPFSRPVLPAVLDYLTGGGSPDTAFSDGDPESLLAIVPTATTVRRLREALLSRHLSSGGSPDTPPALPHLITPEAITSWSLPADPPPATPAAELFVWMQVLQHLPLAEFPGLFPVPPVSRDAAWARGTAGELLRLRRRLEEGGRTVAGAARRLGPGHVEAARWQDLERLEHRALTALEEAGYGDPVSARLAAAAAPAFPAGVTRIALIAVADPVHLVTTALGNAEARGVAVDVLVHADAALAGTFDFWGRPLPEVWNTRVIDIPRPAERIRVPARPDDAARVLAETLRSHERKPAALAIGSADPAVALPLIEEASRDGITVFDPGGIPLMRHELSWFYTCVASLLRGDAAQDTARLLRLPGVLRASPVAVSPAALLLDWDEFHQQHLPRTLTDAAALSEKWKPFAKRRPGPAVNTFLHQVLAWLHEKCEAMRRPDGLAVLSRFTTGVFSSKSFPAPGDRRLFEDAAGLWQDTLESIAAAAAQTGSKTHTTAAAALETAMHLLRDARLYPDNPGRGAVLHGWLELPWQEAPHLAIAGLNEGMAPEHVAGDPWLPDSIRATLDLKTNAQRLARDSYLLTAMIETRRREGSILLLASRETADGDPLKPGRLLLRCPETELPGRVLQVFSEDSQEIRPSPPAWHRAWPLVVPAPAADAPVFSRVSVTQFIDYLSCPFRFYLKHVLRMEPFDPGRDELDARDFGSLIHDSIQKLHQHDELKDSSDQAALAAFLDDTVQELALRRYGPDPALPIIVQLESARKRLAALAGIQAAERADGWRVEHVEQSFPETLDGFSITGKIDLVERHLATGRRRVIDYKTGSRNTPPDKAHISLLRGRHHSHPDWRVFDHGGKTYIWENLQLPFYVWIVSKLGHTGVQAGYINLPPAVSEAGLRMWEDIDDALVASAITCARGILQCLRQSVFWPPAESVEFDDFAPLWFNSLAESFDPSQLEKFRLLQTPAK